MRVRTAIVGCGKVGHIHAAALSTLAESEFVAVCDSVAGRAREFGARYGVVAFRDTAEMVSRARVEAVVVCTPHPLHALPPRKINGNIFKRSQRAVRRAGTLLPGCVIRLDGRRRLFLRFFSRGSAAFGSSARKKAALSISSRLV